MRSLLSNSATLAAMLWQPSRRNATTTRHEYALLKKESEKANMDQVLMNFRSPERSHSERSLKRTWTLSLSALGDAHQALEIKVSCERSCCRRMQARDSPDTTWSAQEEICTSTTICRMTSATVEKASCVIVIGSESAVLASILARPAQVSSTSLLFSSRMSFWTMGRPRVELAEAFLATIHSRCPLSRLHRRNEESE